MLKKLRIVLYVLIVVLLAFVIMQLYKNKTAVVQQSPHMESQDLPTVIPGRRNIGGMFELTAHTGQKVNSKDYLGRYQLVYFGYAYCPDVCPTELFSLAKVIDKAKSLGIPLVHYFITIDPTRDTQQRLSKFVTVFHPELIALTGTEEEIKKVASMYQVYYKKNIDHSAQDYLMDHSTYVYLLNKKGEFVTLFRMNTNPDKIIKAIQDYEATAP